MPTKQQILKFLTISVLPPLSGGIADWLIVHVQVLGAIRLGHDAIAAAVLNLGVFGATAALTWLVQHHVLKGTYAPPKSRISTAGGTAVVGPRL